MTTSKILPSPFKRIVSDEASVAFEAEFDLPNDGTPSGNKLVIRVLMDSVDSEVGEVDVIGRTFKDTVIMTGVVPIASLGNILYGFARIKHVPQLVFN